MRVSIIGPGALGAAQVITLRKRGHDVLLVGFGGHDGIIPGIEANNNMINHVGGCQYDVETGSLEQALGEEIIIITVPASAHGALLKAMAKHDLSAKTVIVLPGGGFMALAKEAIEDADRFPETIVEATTSPYVSRRGDGADIKIFGVKHHIQVAAYPPAKPCLMATMEELIESKLVWYADLASILMSFTKATLHPAVMVDNFDRAAAVGHSPREKFYRDWAPKAMERILALDRERVAGAKALGLESTSHLDFVNQWYGTGSTDYNTFVLSFDGYANVLAPIDVQHRYLTEDAKHLLMMMRELINKAGIKTPVMDDTLIKAGILLGENLFETGRTLSKLKLANVSAEGLVARLNGDD